MDTTVGEIATSYHETPDKTEISDFVTFGIILIYEQVYVCKAEILYFFFSCEKGDKLAGKKADRWQYCHTHRFLRNIIFTEKY